MFTHIIASTIGLGIEKSILALRDSGTERVRENQDRVDTTKEIQLCLDIEYPDKEPFISRCIITDLKGLVNYDKEFLDGIHDEIGWDYTYHSLYEHFYPMVIKELKRNINTRRACIALGQNDINFSIDPPCLQLMMFNYVDGKLEMTAIFRSNDGVKAFPMNIHAIEMLHEKVCKELNLEVGPLHYIANNFHCYSKDYETLEGYCKTFESASEKRRFYSREQLEAIYD